MFWSWATSAIYQVIGKDVIIRIAIPCQMRGFVCKIINNELIIRATK